MIKQTELEYHFALCLQMHKVYGPVFTAVIIADWDKRPFTEILNTVVSENMVLYPELTDVQKKIIDLLGTYDENKILKLFPGKFRDARELQKKITPEQIATKLHPYIETIHGKIFRLMFETQQQQYIFLRSERHVVYLDDQITPDFDALKPVFHFRRNEENLSYRLSVAGKGKNIDLFRKSITVLSIDPCFVIIDHTLHHVFEIDSRKLIPFVSKESISVPRSMEKKYFSTFIQQAVEKYDVKAEGFAVEEQDFRLRAELSLQPVIAESHTVGFVLKFICGKGPSYYPDEKGDRIVISCHEGEKYRFLVYIRKFSEEQEIIKWLSSKGIKQNQRGVFLIKKSNSGVLIHDYIDLIRDISPEASRHHINIVQHELPHLFALEKSDIRYEVSTENDWFDLKMIVMLGETEIPFQKFRKHILNDIREYLLPDGRIFLIPSEWFSKYRTILLTSKDDKGTLRVNHRHYQVLQELSFEINDFSLSGKLAELAAPLEKSDLPDGPPDGLQATLRPYQITGYRWMSLMQKKGFGGCLADDMGLGKTLQTIAVIQSAQNQHGGQVNASKIPFGIQLAMFDSVEKGPGFELPASLVVCPSSLVHNWYNEIRRFAPGLKVMKYTGAERDTHTISISHLVITTYGIARNDSEKLSKYKFFYIILDESQHIRNPESRIFQAVNQLQSMHKLVLTGTPIENSLSDLWSQMTFVNPGILGTIASFRANFLVPIEKQNSDDRKAMLKRIIQPFILRRTRAEVLSELPPVHEQIIFCEMEDQQRKIYETEKSRIRNFILDSIQNNGRQRSSFMILQALTRLRLLANHPAFAGVDFEGNTSKTDEIMNHLEVLVAEGHKVLVFSSFVRHLQMISRQISERGWDYAMLTGSTSSDMREKEVKRFQTDENLKIFLVSLKAGGYGLNLQAAGYVLILDPWWNPAAEEQAIGRAHRMGQKQNVSIYRFISRETIEEKIIALQQSKSKLAQEFVSSSNPLKHINDSGLIDIIT
ncbi:MAG: DEAD/DEAH box helicase [Bacteroidetes bacterium]|nr:DEAD/DEAH box helicase [Bacteroidota bacterium]MBU1720196.1 DEAD/DEAH box helicase [Bacteroidota bacterium]